MNEFVYEKCYAKINLVLNILNKRDDGYHDVDFVMTTVDLYDELRICKSSEFAITGTQFDFPYTENIMYKAFALLKQKYNIQSNITIEIDKNIPIAAGMAGGSSNCAGVLRACNKLFNLNLSLETLANLGSKIGSDVPFCVYQTTLRALGRGEILEPINKDFSNINVLVINPGFELSTKEVYENHDIGNVTNDVPKLLNSDNNFLDYFTNDLQPTSLKISKQLCEFYNQLRTESDVKIMMSGSGPTMLLFSKDKKKLEQIYAKYKKMYKHVYLTKTR